MKLPLSSGVGSGASGVVTGASVVSSPLPKNQKIIHFVILMHELYISRIKCVYS